MLASARGKWCQKSAAEESVRRYTAACELSEMQHGISDRVLATAPPTFLQRDRRDRRDRPPMGAEVSTPEDVSASSPASADALPSTSDHASNANGVPTSEQAAKPTDYRAALDAAFGVMTAKARESGPESAPADESTAPSVQVTETADSTTQTLSQHATILINKPTKRAAVGVNTVVKKRGDDSKGPEVASLRKKGAAAHSELMPGDVIKAVDNVPVSSRRELQKALKGRTGVISLEVVRSTPSEAQAMAEAAALSTIGKAVTRGKAAKQAKAERARASALAKAEAAAQAKAEKEVAAKTKAHAAAQAKAEKVEKKVEKALAAAQAKVEKAAAARERMAERTETEQAKAEAAALNTIGKAVTRGKAAKKAKAERARAGVLAKAEATVQAKAEKELAAKAKVLAAAQAKAEAAERAVERAVAAAQAKSERATAEPTESASEQAGGEPNSQEKAGTKPARTNIKTSRAAIKAQKLEALEAKAARVAALTRALEERLTADGVSLGSQRAKKEAEEASSRGATTPPRLHATTPSETSEGTPSPTETQRSITVSLTKQKKRADPGVCVKASHTLASAEAVLTVARLKKNSPAAHSDLHTGDVITAVNDVPVTTARQLNKMLKGQTGAISLNVMRDVSNIVDVEA